MKALVISDRTEIFEYVTPLLKEKGFDIIHYKWIIKAIDNIEEIQPDIIVLSANEYPRHWKTLAGFVQSGIGGNNVKMYLYETSPLSEDDEKKVNGLGLLSFEEEFCKIDEKLFTSVEVACNLVDGKFLFCNGKLYEDEDLIEIDSELTNGCYLKYLSIFDGNKTLSYSATVDRVVDGYSTLRIKQL